MANTVRNLSREGIYVKLSTARTWVEQCVCEWVRPNVSIRELTREERLARMSQNIATIGQLRDTRAESRRDHYLPPLEPNGCKFIPPASSKTSLREINTWIREAREFCEAT